MPVTSVFRTSRKKYNLGYIVISFLKNPTKRKWESSSKEGRDGKRKEDKRGQRRCKILSCKSSEMDSLTVSDSVSKPYFSKCLKAIMTPNTFWRQLVEVVEGDFHMGRAYL